MAVQDLTKVQICNMAIGHTGSREFIESLTDGSEPSNLCALYYDTFRQKALSAVDWPFARQRQVLAATTLVRSGWQFVYAAPTDLLVLRRMMPTPGAVPQTTPSVAWIRNPRADQKIPVAVENDPPAPLGTGLRKIFLCDQPSPECQYTADIDDASLYPPSFVDAHALLLGSRLCNPLSSDPRRSAELVRQYKEAISDAIAEAFNEELQDQPPASRYEAIRLGGFTGDTNGGFHE